MSCGYGLPTPEDCALTHWCPPTGAERTKDGWRAPCPVKACPTTDRRLLRFWVRGKSVTYDSYCPHHPGREGVKPTLSTLLGACFPRSGRPAWEPPDAPTIESLALSDMPPTSLRLALLELSGMGTQDALDKLGVRRDNRARVIAGRALGASKLTRKRR